MPHALLSDCLNRFGGGAFPLVPLSDAKHKPQRLQNLRAAAWLSLKTSAVEINEQYFSFFKKNQPHYFMVKVNMDGKP